MAQEVTEELLRRAACKIFECSRSRYEESEDTLHGSYGKESALRAARSIASDIRGDMRDVFGSDIDLGFLTAQFLLDLV